MTNCDLWADRFQTPKPDSKSSSIPSTAESEIPIIFDVTLRYFFLEFWTPVGCKPSGIVSTSLKKFKKIYSRNYVTHFFTANFFFGKGAPLYVEEIVER